jgi:hypothetical protein
VGSTELGLGIVLLCVSVAIGAAWGSDRDETAVSRRQSVAQGAAVVTDASAASVADNSLAP